MHADPELSARAAQFLYTYARAVDLRDLDTLRSLVTEDVRLTRPDGTHQGPDAFMLPYMALASSPPDSSKHAVTNVRAFREGPDQIRVEAYFQATSFGADQTRMVFGRYSDSLREYGGGFRFVHKRNIVERVLVLPAAVAG